MDKSENDQVDACVCRWCGGPVTVGPGPAIKPVWKRYWCEKCGVIDYMHLPNQADIDFVYSSAWSETEDIGAFAAGNTDGCISASLLDSIAWVGKGLSCLDYGAGKGTFSRELIARGGKVVAIEPYGEEPDFGTAGQVLWLQTLDDIPDDTLFEWIFLVEVIEHMLDPIADLTKLHNKLLPGGRLFVTTPNANGWRARKDGFNWREAQNPTHITLFSENSLDRCLSKSGFSKTLRIKKPVDYGKRGFSRLALAVTQVLGVDGGLHYVATK